MLIFEIELENLFHILISGILKRFLVNNAVVMVTMRNALVHTLAFRSVVEIVCFSEFERETEKVLN